MNNSPDPNSPLRQQDTSVPISTPPMDLTTSPLLRNPHRRQTSQGTIRFADQVQEHGSPSSPMHEFQMEPIDSSAQGLGISRSGRPMSITRVPVGSRGGQTPPAPLGAFPPSMKSPNRVAPSPPTPINPYFSNSSSKSSPRTPGSAKPFLSPSQISEPGGYSFDKSGLTTMREQDDEEHDIFNGQKQSFADTLNSKYGARDDKTDDRNKGFASHEVFEQENGSSGNLNSNDNDQTGLLDGCPARHDVLSPRNNWLSISILILSIYSTVFSGIYLVVALYQPRYGRRIHTGGRLSPATASTLFTLFAKTIELSFVTVFVAFLGQVLSRRSFVKASRGVNIAELTMRTWVLQPGFMITHWHVLQHAGVTILGAITLTAAFIAMSYTTASDALVSPHLKYGNWQDKVMHGWVKASYANKFYVDQTCVTPVPLNVDPDNRGLTCLSVLHAGQAQHNHMTFLDAWNQISATGDGISEFSQRPKAPAIMFDNTTVTGSWILTNTSNMATAYTNYTRVINNVSLAMPHAGVIAAAHRPQNAILQPEELDGVGEYSIKAAVVSPAVNVLCVNMNVNELEPIVNVTSIPQPGTTFLNSTVVDDIFEWGPKYNRQPPTFPKYPIEYNSLINVTVAAPVYDLRDSIYLLIKAEDITTNDYTVCQIRSFLTSSCSTHYNVSGKTGGKLMSLCEDSHNDTAYHASVPDAPSMVRVPDWRDVGSQWFYALSLGTGISNANASTARLLSQFIVVKEPVVDDLPSLMPTIGESLAVMAGSTLLLSSLDARFTHSKVPVSNATQMPFNASVASQEYTSGYVKGWQSMFYVPLFLVFVTNVVCLIYFLIRPGLVTDYTEPQNLFALAINSPPSRRLNGSCGAGPEGDQFNVDWHVSREENSDHYFIKDGTDGSERETNFLGLRRRKQKRRQLNHVSSYTTLSSKRKSWL